MRKTHQSLRTPVDQTVRGLIYANGLDGSRDGGGGDTHIDDMIALPIRSALRIVAAPSTQSHRLCSSVEGAAAAFEDLPYAACRVAFTGDGAAARFARRLAK